MTRWLPDPGRPVHRGPYPLETLRYRDEPGPPDLSGVPPTEPVAFRRPDAPESIVNAMGEYQAMLDALRDGLVNRERAQCPADPAERARHLKGFGYFCDASMVGVCELPAGSGLATPRVNPGVAALGQALRTRQTETLAAGIDTIMAALKESMEAPPTTIEGQTHALVLLYGYPRDPRPDEPGASWIQDAQAARACLRAGETAVVVANYLRLLGYPSRAHSGTASDVDLNRLTVAAGLAVVERGRLVNPFLGERFGVAVVTTAFALEPDRPLAPLAEQPARRAGVTDPFARRRFADGAHPFERLKRVERPTTYIDEAHLARVPKRADMFARAQFGDMGRKVQDGTVGGRYVAKSAISAAQRRALGALVLIQNGDPAPSRAPGTDDPRRNAEHIKAACYFLGIDAVGLSRCPDWAYYSHDALGEPIEPYHAQAISMIVDQGYETMEGASGDDWISVAQSMRAYLRFSLLGGVIARQIRNLGYPARAHTVMDGEVLQPPLLLLSGLGEVSRIGEVILNPYLGPRLKSGVVTTDLPLAHDRPIDFGLQAFCERCNKCARECPSGAITAGPKLMFNGYEIWKSDSQKCATYRITTDGGAMCGRCMKTCPWNLQGVLVERPFRWLAMRAPHCAPLLARLDDALGNGGLNPVKKWWWDLELQADGGYRPAGRPVNARDLRKDLKLRYEDQTLAVYPADLAPHPYPYPYPMDREKGIAAYRALIGADAYRRRLAAGDTAGLFHRYRAGTPGRDSDGPPVLRLTVSRAEPLAPGIVRYDLSAPDGAPLPAWQAGAHLDVVVAPEFLRQYSLAGDPADRSRYRIAVLREECGRGGSRLLQRIFGEGRRVFVGRPVNHFPLDEGAAKSLLLGGGIGVTPLLAMAHRLHALGADFELHYSVRSRAVAGFLPDLENVPWRGRVRLHVSDEATRLDPDRLLGAGWQPGWQMYVCGPARYIRALGEAAERHGVPAEAVHREYFAAPAAPAYVDHDFTLRLARSGREVPVPAGQPASEALTAAGVAVDVKCSDGLCGVCRCAVLDGEVEHRDVVLSAEQRRSAMILCQSRAAKQGAVLTVDL